MPIYDSAYVPLYYRTEIITTMNFNGLPFGTVLPEDFIHLLFKQRAREWPWILRVREKKVPKKPAT